MKPRDVCSRRPAGTAAPRAARFAAGFVGVCAALGLAADARAMPLGPVVLAAAARPALAAPAASVRPTLIRNARVHTLAADGVREGVDVLVEHGRIAAIGPNLAAPAGAEIVDARGRPVTPGLFAGLTVLGLEETGMVASAADETLKLGSMRPEFDVALAYNPDSIAVGVTRAAGMTFTVVTPAAAEGGSIVAGQGAALPLDGSLEPWSRALFVDLGGNAAEISGGSRAAQFMLLRQALLEARAPNLVMVHDERLLTPSGRQRLVEFLKGAGPIVFEVDRAADIRHVIAFASREQLPNVVIAGGAEAWRVAGELAAARIPVVLDPLANLPQDFDAIGATLENAARLHRAGVKIAFSIGTAESHNSRKVRQAAGIAVAYGLPWDAALAALTRAPAEIFGAGDRAGVLAPGRPADLVLWSGDPLEVTTVAERVWIGGRPQPARTRQTELRDRYLEKLKRGEAR